MKLHIYIINVLFHKLMHLTLLFLELVYLIQYYLELKPILITQISQNSYNILYEKQFSNLHL